MRGPLNVKLYISSTFFVQNYRLYTSTWTYYVLHIYDDSTYSAFPNSEIIHLYIPQL